MAVKRVLVAEDNEVNRELVRELLINLGHEVFEAGNGKEALELLERCKPDLLLVDIQMPVLDGVELIRRLKNDSQYANYRSVPVVALTAYAMHGDREKLLGEGFDDYLSKPFQATAFMEKVNQHLDAAPPTRPSRPA